MSLLKSKLLRPLAALSLVSLLSGCIVLPVPGHRHYHGHHGRGAVVVVPDAGYDQPPPPPRHYRRY